MAFVQAIGEDGRLLDDSNGNPILIPASMVEGSKGRSNITVANEVLAREKRTDEQKLEYQGYLAKCQITFFENMKVTRGKVVWAGQLPVIMSPEEVEKLRNEKMSDRAMLDDLIDSAVHHAFINQSLTLVNSLYKR